MAASESELDDGRMPFLEHLREFRSRLRNSAIAFMIATVACWFYAGKIYQALLEPYQKAIVHHPKLATTTMKYNVITEPFWVGMSVAMWSGIFAASPFIFYQLWKFIAPGLYKTERRYGLGFAVMSGLCFIGGALFCYYFVLPNLYSYLLGYADRNNHPVLSMSTYFDLTKNMMLAFGVVFELPILIFFLAMVGLVTPRGL